jgi:phosphoribosylglycinamide formyltransferase-1
MSAPKLRLAVLISGRGSNMIAIARACLEQRIHATVVLVISDRTSAAGIEVARGMGLDSRIIVAKEFPDRAAFEGALARSIDESGADLVVLAGFMRILSPSFVARYRGRMLNIHPSLLPNHKGLHTHRNVLLSGDREHGSSVHFVTDELDGGPVIYQSRFAVRAGDDEQSLEARILELEHWLYPEVIGLIACGRLELRDDTLLLDGNLLRAPLMKDAEYGATHAVG